MLPQFLIPETVVRKDGTGPTVPVDAPSILLTLGINRIVEQESLDVSIWSSADGEAWTELAAFPQKFYCGTSSLLLDLKTHPDAKILQARWKMGRWGRGDLTPLFGFYVFAEEIQVPVSSPVKAG
jgi:hypothetical protein